MAQARVWRIELCERPVKKARQIDYVLFGKPMAHPFLALIDENEQVRGELHLAPFDRTSRNKRTRINRLLELSTAATSPFGIDKIFRRIVAKTPWKSYYPTLHSHFHDCAQQYARATEHTPVVCGTPAQMRIMWYGLRTAAANIDQRELPYDRFGWGKDRNNCQTGLVSVMTNVGLNPAPLSGRYAAPGWKSTP